MGQMSQEAVKEELETVPGQECFKKNLNHLHGPLIKCNAFIREQI